MHCKFPGFLADPQVVFDALWDRRTTTRVAGRELPCCDVLGNALIMALHVLRTPNWTGGQTDLGSW